MVTSNYAGKGHAMRYYQGRYKSEGGREAEGFGLHAVDEAAEELYTYVQDLKTWNRNLTVEDHFYFPELHEGKGQVIFNEVSHESVYELMAQIPKFDRRDEAQRRLSTRAFAQLRKSGQVLTSAEVGLLTKHLGQRPAAAPQIQELIETRSQHKRWTALMLYEEDGATRRKAISTLRANTRLNISSKGHPLEAQHKTKRFVIDGEERKFIVVEVKYVRPADQGISGMEAGSDV